jgi:hypothetical protein
MRRPDFSPPEPPFMSEMPPIPSEAPPQTDEACCVGVIGRPSRRSEAEPECAFGAVPSAREAL